MKPDVAIIFGVSSGLGYSLVESYLSLNVRVIGVGRRNTIIHPNYQFVEKDLSVEQDWSSFFIDLAVKQSHIQFIYNAGTLGEVNPIVGVKSSPKAVFQLNVFSWMDIVHHSLNYFPDHSIISFAAISSGAGRRGISCWSQYGGSKAALDNFMLCLKTEISTDISPVSVVSFSPGVMNTDMQKNIRNLPKSNFKDVAQYQRLYEEGKLRDTSVVAQCFISYLSGPISENVLIGVQDVIPLV